MGATPTDYMLAAGLLIFAFSIPAMLAAYADSRPPRLSMAACILSASTIALAWVLKPGGYEMVDVPNTVVLVIAEMLK